MQITNTMGYHGMPQTCWMESSPCKDCFSFVNYSKVIWTSLMGIFSSTPFSATPANQGAEFSPLTNWNHPFGGGGVGVKMMNSYFTGCSNTLRLKVVGAQDSKQSSFRTRSLLLCRFQTLHWKFQRFLG